MAGLTAAHLRDEKWAPRVQGQQGEEIRAEVGYSADEIFALEDRGIVATVEQMEVARRR
jgi:hypothetical protein